MVEQYVSLPKARVQWWNTQSIYVLCPFCHEVHHHGFNGTPTTLDPSPYSLGRHLCRLAHCGPTRHRNSTYYLDFPRDPANNTILYEIDKVNLRFIADKSAQNDVTLDGDEIRRWRSKFASHVARKHKWTDASESIVLFDVLQIKKIDEAIAQMCHGNVPYVRHTCATF